MQQKEIIHAEGFVEFEELTRLGVTNAMSGKDLGNMSYSRSKDGSAESNFLKFMALVGVSLNRHTVAVLEATHSTNIARLENQPNSFGRQIVSGENSLVKEIRRFEGVKVSSDYLKSRDSGIDAVVTNSRELIIGVLPADCAICSLFDPITKTLAVVHAGAIGIFSEIAPKTVSCMTGWFRVKPENLYCCVSPCVKGSEYKLVESGLWKNVFSGIVDDHYATDFDQREILTEQLVEAGILKSKIYCSDMCTLGSNYFFSSGRAKSVAEKQAEGRNMVISGMITK